MAEPEQKEVAGADPLRDAMEAHRAGRLAEADALYAEAVRRQPAHARALRLRGILARELGDLPRSAQLLRRAADVAPGDAAPLAELGVTWLAAGELRRAEVALRAALAREPSAPRALANLGALLHYRGRVRDAIGLHEQLIAVDPEDLEVRCNLAHARVDAGEGEAALAACDEALELAPGDPAVLATRGAVCCTLGRLDEAVPFLEGALARRPDDDLALVNLAFAEEGLGRADAAREALRRAVRANADNARAVADLAAMAGPVHRDEALAGCAAFLARHRGERLVTGTMAYLLRDAGRETEAASLLDLDGLVQVRELPDTRGRPDRAALDRALAAFVTAHPSLLESPASKATRGGGQTGELEAADDPAVAALCAAVDVAVTDYVAALRVAGLGEHAAMAPAAARWHLRLWGTVLRPGGAQAPHMHPLGWLSGVYYARVPEVMDAAGGGAGWLEFGRPPPRLRTVVPPVVRRVQPVEGRLVIFPSWLYHRTLPFAAPGERVSLAFDVMPRLDGID